MPFIAPLIALGVATAGFMAATGAATAITRTSDTVEEVGNRALGSGLGITAASAAALAMGGPVVAMLALGAGVAGISAAVTGAKVKYGDPAEAARLAAFIDQDAV